MIRKTLALVTATVTAAVAGVLVIGPQATAHDAAYRAKLRDPGGTVVGTVEFRITRDAMHVDAELWKNSYVTPNAFHGFHVHANNDETNGRGCQADAGQPSTTWFVSADGHLSETGQGHGQHNGDMPSPLVLKNGTARLQFATDRIAPEALRGRAVVLHANPDNFGNVPVGSGPNQYTPNSPGATDLTARTGNAGDRVACGVVRRWW